MHIKILARNRFNYSNRRFREEAKKMGVKLTITDPMEYEVLLSKNSPDLFRNGKILEKVDCVLPRTGASINNYGVAVLTQFEMKDIPVINSSTAILRTRNKLRAIQWMTRHNIDMPKTVFIRQASGLKAAIEAVGGFPVIMKLLSGTQGIGVMIAESYRTIESTLDTLWSLGQDILIQECIQESLGKDVRVIVAGDKVIAAMTRNARIGEFRSNIHRGGVGAQLELTEEYREIAVKAAKATKLEIAGVDMLVSHTGPKVIEVNSSPGLEGIEAATGINVAQRMLEYCIDRVENKKSNE
jgi:ribosomal protein S6--L-glutamate ligase